MAGTLKLGSSYSSFSDLEAAIDAYERCKFVNYYKRSSRSIEAHKKRCPKIANAANPALVHAEITYFCICGGKNFKSRGKGQRQAHQ